MQHTVFAVALNHKSQLDAWQKAFEQPPYKTPPQTPVWFIKPRNTLAHSGDTIGYPAGETVLSGGTLALVIGKTARKVAVAEAAHYIAGFRLANDISLPETAFYRPAIKAKCRDGFCPLGELSPVQHIDPLEIVTEINGTEVDRWNTADLQRNAGQLLCALSDFATLQAGDCILLGTPQQRATLQPGDEVVIRANGFTPLSNRMGTFITQTGGVA